MRDGQTIDLEEANGGLAGASADEIVRWALREAGERPLVSTNFRPYEAVILHLATRHAPGIPVLWVDHGHNRPATAAFAERLAGVLGLELRRFGPLEVVPVPAAVHTPEDERTAEEDDLIHRFSEQVKLEPFRRGMDALRPTVWFTALRRVQNPNREGMRVVERGPGGVLKVNPLLDWNDQDMENYLAEHELPNEWDYFDPAKAGEKRECGLHTRLR